jgi:hypothetical protein
MLVSRCSCTGILRVPGDGKRLAARQNALMVKRIAPVGIVTFCFLAACGALGQSERPVGVLQRLPSEGATPTQVQREAAQFLPDAPSVQVEAIRFQPGSAEGCSPVTIGKVWMNAGGKLATDTAFRPSLNATVLDSLVRPQKRFDDFFSKYMVASRTQDSRYQPSSSDKLMGRATEAASRIFVMRDESGKRHLNTQYFLRVLTSVAADNASRRYRARSSAAPLSTFGSAVGNDAGMNLLHEFGPGIRQRVTCHMPDFVSRIGEHIRLQNPR